MEEQTQTLEEIVQTQYTYWKEKVDSLNKLLKKLPDLIDLQTIVYLLNSYVRIHTMKISKRYVILSKHSNTFVVTLMA